jgi:hypothetical protein
VNCIKTDDQIGLAKNSEKTKRRWQNRLVEISENEWFELGMRDFWKWIIVVFLPSNHPTAKHTLPRRSSHHHMWFSIFSIFSVNYGTILLKFWFSDIFWEHLGWVNLEILNFRNLNFLNYCHLYSEHYYICHLRSDYWLQAINVVLNFFSAISGHLTILYWLKNHL